MRYVILTVGLALLAGGCVASNGASQGTAAMIASAKSAAPASIADDATIVDTDGKLLRQGSNGYTCMPDRPDTDGTDPMCLDASWLKLINGYVNKEQPDVEAMGIAYMLAGDSAVSNSDPYAGEYTSEDDWVEGLGAHLMIALPGDDALDHFPIDPFNGGPWVMWPGTPYQHLMVPIDSYGR